MHSRFRGLADTAGAWVGVRTPLTRRARTLGGVQPLNVVADRGSGRDASGVAKALGSSFIFGSWSRAGGVLVRLAAEERRRCKIKNSRETLRSTWASNQAGHTSVLGGPEHCSPPGTLGGLEDQDEQPELVRCVSCVSAGLSLAPPPRRGCTGLLGMAGPERSTARVLRAPPSRSLRRPPAIRASCAELLNRTSTSRRLRRRLISVHMLWIAITSKARCVDVRPLWMCAAH